MLAAAQVLEALLGLQSALLVTKIGLVRFSTLMSQDVV